MTNYELGAKGRLFGGMIDYQADVYVIKWDNIQVQETTADGAFVYLGNAGTARVKGVEFEFTAHPFEISVGQFCGLLSGCLSHSRRLGGAICAESNLGPNRRWHSQRSQVPVELRDSTIRRQFPARGRESLQAM